VSRLDIEPTWDEIERFAGEIYGDAYFYECCSVKLLDMEHRAEQHLLERKKAQAKGETHGT
jgi:hypothetical protein